MKKFRISHNTQFAVLGLSKFGKGLTHALTDNGYHVLCCDIDEQTVQENLHIATHIIQADASDKAVLEKIGISNFDVVIIAFGRDFESAAVTATILKELKVNYIIVKANGVRQKQIFESIGVDRVILPEKEMGERVAYSLITNDLMDSIHRSDKYDIIEMKPLPEWEGKSLDKLRLRQTESINVIAIIRENEVMAVLDAKTVLLPKDDLIVLKSR
ncbi:MAG: TrkA family potassium uptake protein [Anaerocolumna sp.]|jgi:trk system potassium uptake protein TrkA|nr:TrkA family potassium uptake protein [Anaerocolumna sp.]